MMQDATGFDIGPIVQDAAERYGISVALLLGTLKAESNLRPDAARNGKWPDVSFGMCQMTVQTARMYGIGDGSGTQENIDRVRVKLFDRNVAVEVCAAHLKRCRHTATLHGGGSDLETMVVYNAGRLPLKGDAWWQRYAGHVARYQQCLSWAEKMIGGQ